MRRNNINMSNTKVQESRAPPTLPTLERFSRLAHLLCALLMLRGKVFPKQQKKRIVRRIPGKADSGTGSIPGAGPNFCGLRGDVKHLPKTYLKLLNAAKLNPS